MKTFRHKSLGEFEFDDLGWFKKVDISIFPELGFIKDHGESDIEIVFEVDDEEPPSDSCTELIDEIIQNQCAIISEILDLLYKDLCGLGTSSGIWWHGCLPQINKSFSNDIGLIANASDLKKYLYQPTIYIQESTYGYENPCGIIGFECHFEPEHGVGAITNGKSVIGLGFQMDASPFEGD